MKIIINRKYTLQGLVVIALLFALAGFPSNGQAAACDSSTYFVQPGDTLYGIANKCSVPYSTLLQLNPQITNPNLIIPNEIIYLTSPGFPNTGHMTRLQLTPLSAPAGSQVTVSGIAFLNNASVQLTVSQASSTPVITQTVKTDNSGNFSAQITIPSNASPGSIWTIKAVSQPYNFPTASTQFQVATRTSTVRIRFAPDATSGVLVGNLPANSSQTYILSAQAGQLMEVNLTPEQGLHMSIRGTDGTQVASQATFFRGLLPKTEEYLLVVSSGNQAQQFTLNINIPLRITFAPGGTSASLPGILAAGTSQYYILRALANQNLQVNVQSSTGPRLVIYGVDGTVLRSGMGEGASFSGPIPKTQDYLIVLSSSSQVIPYTLNVIIPPSTSGLPTTGGQATYTVQQGDYLSQIASRFGVTMQALLAANPQIINPNLIRPGEKIVIP